MVNKDSKTSKFDISADIIKRKNFMIIDSITMKFLILVSETKYLFVTKNKLL